MTHRFRFLVFIAAFILGLPTTAHATDIAKPHFMELVESADVIVIGTVTGVFPSLSFYGPFIIYGVGFAVVGCLLLWRRLRPLAILLSAVAFLLLGLAVAEFLFGWSGYRRVATIAVSQVVKGELGKRSVNVYYDNPRYNDLTEFRREAEYVLFLDLRGSMWTAAWHNWGVWEITSDGVITVGLERIHAPPKPLSAFLARVQGIMDNPTNSEFAGIWKQDDGTTRRYRIHEDHFFNPKAQRAEEAAQSGEGDEM